MTTGAISDPAAAREAAEAALADSLIERGRLLGLTGNAAGEQLLWERFLVDEAGLLAWTAELGGQLLDPIKTTNVQGLRCMTTWVVRKGA